MKRLSDNTEETTLISKKEAEIIREECISWSLTHGLFISGNCPIAVLPTKIPRSLFYQAQELAPLFSELVHKVSLDVNFIYKVLSSVDDKFTKHMISILKHVSTEGVAQKKALGIHRSDYMIHQPQGTLLENAKLLQVEINTISSAFGGLGTMLSQLHKYLIERFGVANLSIHNLPQNNALDGLADALAQAQSFHSVKGSVVVMVVNKGETNSSDQRLLEYKLWEDRHISLIRRSLTDMAERATLDETTKDLKIDGNTVAVCYYRSGYRPEDYPSDKEWTARLMMERSNAIKCPNINYHLAGTKKMQQVLSVPGMVEKFIPDKDSAALLRSCFAGMYSLDQDDHPEEVIKRVVENPDDYVMKPQREGGGNLLFGESMTTALKTMSPTERSDYIIMEKIVPVVADTYVILKTGNLAIMDGISELGIFGVFIGDDKTTYLNSCPGAIIRTKSSNDADGGVCAGVAVLDTPYLI